ncbi:MAG TPA: hypothetical protein VF575_00715 [Candidatus Saccharimonadales bacterium]|jgi:membrane protein YdbS with pleckstrin-like domain
MNFINGSLRSVNNKDDKQKSSLAITWIIVILTGIATAGNLYLLINGEFFQAHWFQQVLSVLYVIWLVAAIKQLVNSKNHR